MALLISGKKFVGDLSKSGALAVYMPLEGGHEGRYQRRVRGAGYDVMVMTARGLGDPAAYLLDVHGIRPPHLGKKDIGTDGAVGYRYYIPPVARYRLEQLPSKSKGLVLWLLEGNILAQQELAFLAQLPNSEPRIKVAIEMGGDREFSWKPLEQALPVA